MIIGFSWRTIFTIGGNILLSFSVPTPEITYGEFPFWLEYTIDGKTIIVEDVFIAEFQGFNWNLGLGGHRVWSGWIESSGEEMVFILEDGSKRIYATVGGARYYMGDWHQTDEPFTPRIIVVISDDRGGTLTSGREELFEEYDIELISWELSPPIVNSFR